MKIKISEIFEYAKEIEKDVLNREVLTEGEEYNKIKTIQDVEEYVTKSRGFLVPRPFLGCKLTYFIDYEEYKDIKSGLLKEIRCWLGRHDDPILYCDRLEFLSCSYNYSEVSEKDQSDYHLAVKFVDKHFRAREYEFTYVFNDTAKLMKSGLREMTVNDIASCGLTLHDSFSHTVQYMHTEVPVDIRSVMELDKNVNKYNKFHTVTAIKSLPENESEKVLSAVGINNVADKISEQYNARVKADKEKTI